MNKRPVLKSSQRLSNVRLGPGSPNQSQSTPKKNRIKAPIFFTHSLFLKKERRQNTHPFRGFTTSTYNCFFFYSLKFFWENGKEIYIYRMIPRLIPRVSRHAHRVAVANNRLFNPVMAKRSMASQATTNGTVR